MQDIFNLCGKLIVTQFLVFVNIFLRKGIIKKSRGLFDLGSAPLRTSRIVVSYRLGTLGSAHSLLDGERYFRSPVVSTRRKNNTQLFFLGCRFEPPPLVAERFKSKGERLQRKEKRHPEWDTVFFETC